MPINISITHFKNALTKEATPFTVEAAIEVIKGDALENKTNQYRLENGKKRDAMKKTHFPAVCWSASQYKNNQRAANNCEQHSGLICIDIDKLSEFDYNKLIQLLPLDEYTFIMFTSPSGYGIKVIIKISDTFQHLELFNGYSQYFLQEYGITVDASGKDVSRLCFLCLENPVKLTP